MKHNRLRSHGGLDINCPSPYLIDNRKRSETASALALVACGGPKFRTISNRRHEPHRLQLDALLLSL
jgi:hypothetical protein